MVTVSNASVQQYLFKNGDERFILKGGLIGQKAPDWIMQNKQALRLRKEEKISFEVKRKLTEEEQLRERCMELGIVIGDGTSIANMEKLIADKEKELEDAKN